MSVHCHSHVTTVTESLPPSCHALCDLHPSLSLACHHGHGGEPRAAAVPVPLCVCRLSPTRFGLQTSTGTMPFFTAAGFIHRHSRVTAMAATSAPSAAAPQRQVAPPPSTSCLPEIRLLVSSSRPGDLKKAVDMFPRFIVRCFLKESDNSSTAVIDPFKNGRFLKNFDLLANWDIIRAFDDQKCRYAHVLSHRVNFCITPQLCVT